MAKYRAKRSFTFTTEYRMGEVRELNAEEALRYSELIEPIGITVNSLDDRPDKKYKKGRNK